MEVSILIRKMTIFSVLMLIGYILARRGLVEKGFGRSASMLALNVFLPATILNSVFIADMQLAPGALGKVMLILTLTLGVGFVLGALIARIVPVGKDPNRGAVFELLLGLSNTMFIGLPVAQELYGPIAVFYCALSCIPFNIYAYTYGVWRLKGGRSGKLRVKDMVSVPLLATIVSLVIFLLHIPVPVVVRDLAATLSGATVPISLLVIGFSMGTVSLADAFRNKALYLASALRNVVFPLLVWLLVRLLTDDTILLMTCVLLAASPGAVMTTILAIQYGRDNVFAAEGVLQGTVFSIVTIPLLILLLG